MEIQAEQVHGLFGGLQASSYEDANIVMIKVSSGAFNQCSLPFNLNP
jgi:phage head maturation protease